MEMRLKVKKCAQVYTNGGEKNNTGLEEGGGPRNWWFRASRKAKLVALKGERTVLLKVLESLKSISKASSGLCLLNQALPSRARGHRQGSAFTFE
ncbi:hypothetical protein Cadr_000004042 [Camelus dromedarius]|uniref:Uncharacterized protein n=1 Tax=Camelus dromedarius TaxID=9838 RepID=A0A5N4EBE8_CAMDR|nr:hypothetical protein Cadr_000004042 [Camelus dromedarius]